MQQQVMLHECRNATASGEDTGRTETGQGVLAQQEALQGSWERDLGLHARGQCKTVHLVLPAQVDLDMLNVSLGTGTLEIRSALLNTEYLTQQLVRLALLTSMLRPH